MPYLHVIYKTFVYHIDPAGIIVHEIYEIIYFETLHELNAYLQRIFAGSFEKVTVSYDIDSEEDFSDSGGLMEKVVEYFDRDVIMYDGPAGSYGNRPARLAVIEKIKKRMGITTPTEPGLYVDVYDYVKYDDEGDEEN